MKNHCIHNLPQINCITNELSKDCLILLKTINDLSEWHREDSIDFCVPKGFLAYSISEMMDDSDDGYLFSSYENQDVTLKITSHGGVDVYANLKLALTTDVSRLESKNVFFDCDKCESIDEINNVVISPRDVRYLLAYLIIECQTSSFNLIERELIHNIKG